MITRKWEDKIDKKGQKQGIGLTMPITITSEINPIPQCTYVYLDDSALLQCRIGLISEVIMIGIVYHIPM